MVPPAGPRRCIISGVPRYHRQAALIVVDVPNDFAHPDGSLYVRGGGMVVTAATGEVRRARAAGATVVYTQDWHPPSTPHFAKDGGLWPVHCVAGSWGAALHPRLLVEGEVVRKGTEGHDGYSGFSLRDPRSGRTTTTRLDDLLRRAGVRDVVIVGLATDYCVKETALDAARRGYRTAVLHRAVRAVEQAPGDGERAIAALRAAGVSLE